MPLTPASPAALTVKLEAVAQDTRDTGAGAAAGKLVRLRGYWRIRPECGRRAALAGVKRLPLSMRHGAGQGIVCDAFTFARQAPLGTPGKAVTASRTPVSTINATTTAQATALSRRPLT